MSENMEKFRHLDGNMAVVESEYMRIVFQHGDPADVGINGCRIEDVLDVIVEKLLDFQGRDLSCEENATALYHLDLAREALLLRRRRREMQGLIGKRDKHKSE
ncbi:MAG: hypothetical protein KF824_10955 [Fimbriimonadaceae bacterium]|nr:hypothetical protein [Fimbriimonadaceae bacterium]QYK52770.1 MAG: hypothetical protein KF824_10955 [Fimbriimonadaceae bacterium]